MHKIKKISILLAFAGIVLSIFLINVYAEDSAQKKPADKPAIEKASDAEYIVFSVKVPKSVKPGKSKTSNTANIKAESGEKAAGTKADEAKVAVSKAPIDQQMAECKKNLEDIVKEADEETKSKESEKEVAKHLNMADMFSITGKLNEAKKEYAAAMSAARTSNMKKMIRDRQSAAEERAKNIELKKHKTEEEMKKKKAAEEAVRRRDSEEMAKKKTEEEKSARKAGEGIRKKKVDEEKAKKRAEEEIAKKKAEEEAAGKKAEKEAAEKKAEEEKAAKSSEKETAIKKAAEEKAAKRTEGEIARKKAEREIAAKKAEGEEITKKAEREMVRKRTDEEAAAMKAAEEKLAASNVETDSVVMTKAAGPATDKIIASISQTPAATVIAPSGYETPAPVQPPAVGEDISSMYKEAVALYWNGRYGEAKMKFEQVQKASPEYARTNYYLGRVKENLSK